MNPLTRVRQRARRTADALSALAFTLALPVVLAMALFAKEGTSDEPTLNPFIVRAQEARKVLNEQRNALLAKAESEKRADLTEEESTEFRRLTGEIKTHDERIAELFDSEQREQAAADAAAGVARAGGAGGGVIVKREPLTYEREKRTTSYFRDLGLAYVGGDEEARQRLQRHRQEMDVELPKREARMEAEFARAMESLSVGEARAAVERRALSRVDGAGGDFVPPLWLMDEYAALARAGRPFLELVRNVPLPGGTDTINIPIITGGAATAAQTADNAAVASTDMTTSFASAPVRTIAGQQDIALQFLEQSPLAFDEIVFADLLADYNEKADTQALSGAGTSGTLKGVTSVSGTTAVTYTDTTPTVPELFPKGADTLQQVATARKRVPNAWIMHPRRWFWMTAALDPNGRPLVLPNAQMPQNSLAEVRDQVFQGPVGNWHGLPVILDPHVLTNLGAGTNEDRIISTLTTDHILFEGALRTRALAEVLSGTLTVRLQLYRYVAFTAERYPAGIGVIAGTGLATPTF